MSGLFNWATGTLASMTSSVMAPFRADSTPAKIEVRLSSKHAYRNQAGAKQKKRAMAKRRAKQAAAAANKAVDSANEEGDDHSDDDSGSNQGSDQPVQEHDERTREILQKMAEAAEERRLEEQKEREAELDRLRQREELLTNSVVRELPADPLASERAATLETLRADLLKIGTGEEFKKFEDFTQNLPAKQREYDEFATRLDQTLRALGKKTPKAPYDKQEMTPQELRTMIQDEELKPNVNELEVKSLLDALTAIISQAGQKRFFNEIQELQNTLSALRSKLLTNYEACRLEDSRQRAIERLIILYESFSGGTEPSEPLDPSAVVGKNMELPVDFSTLAQHQRRIERMFLSVITPPRQRQRGRSIRVWGHEGNVDNLMEWLRESDLTGRQKRTYDRRLAGMIVGRNGATIYSIEASTNTILSLDNTNTLTVFGRPEDIEKVWTAIDDIKVDTRQQQVSKSINIDARLGRAILALHRSKIQAIEDQFQCRVNVSLQPDDGEPRIFVRCSAEKQDAVLAEVSKTLVDEYCVVEFAGSARAISRMLIPPKMPGRARLIYNEFNTFQQDLGLFVQRDGPRGAEADTVQKAGIWIVCRSNDRAVVESTVSQILKKADYQTERISIMREQQRIFNADSRGLIEASSGGCRVSIVNNPQEGTLLMLVGTEESIERGKQIVRDILEREGAVQTVDLTTSGDGAAVSDYLLRDGAAVLRSMEDLHAVSIHIDRAKMTARIVGDKTAIENAAKEISEIGQEIARSHEDFIRLVVTVDADKIPILIGRTGSNIQQICSIPGVESVDVPSQSQCQDAAVVDVVLVGREAALQEAQKFIERLVSRRNDEGATKREQGVDYGQRIGRGRGRRAETKAKAGATGGEAGGAAAAAGSAPGILQFEDSAFPALGEVMAVDDA